MSVAKRQGREKPGRETKRRSKEGPRTGVRTSAFPTKPKLLRAGPGGEKNI